MRTMFLDGHAVNVEVVAEELLSASPRAMSAHNTLRKLPRVFGEEANADAGEPQKRLVDKAARILGLSFVVVDHNTVLPMNVVVVVVVVVVVAFHEPIVGCVDVGCLDKGARRD